MIIGILRVIAVSQNVKYLRELFILRSVNRKQRKTEERRENVRTIPAPRTTAKTLKTNCVARFTKFLVLKSLRETEEYQYGPQTGGFSPIQILTWSV